MGQPLVEYTQDVTVKEVINSKEKIEHITSGEAMKYAVTGGVVDLDEEKVEVPQKIQG